MPLEGLKRKCTETRLALLDEIEAAGSGHYGSSLSCIELLIALYYDHLRIDPKDPNWPERDRFVLSKGHACSAVYPILADLGFFESWHLESFTKLGTILGDHPDMNKCPGFDFSSGSLGHGLSIAVGMAEGLRIRGNTSRVVAMIGDGELNEGQIWEAAAYASASSLSNLLAVIDVNGVSVDGDTADVLSFEPLAEKWASFGWNAERIDGHDLSAIRAALERYDERRANRGSPPTVLVADTIVGRGISFIEGLAEWHVGYLHGIDRERAEHDILAMYAGVEGQI